MEPRALSILTRQGFRIERKKDVQKALTAGGRAVGRSVGGPAIGKAAADAPLLLLLLLGLSFSLSWMMEGSGPPCHHQQEKKTGPYVAGRGGLPPEILLCYVLAHLAISYSTERISEICM